ncbi:MFS transporter [Rhodococcus sp. WMMA185]|uniref:MFS transporter n=1 Tax=Rhodococcus sp. WMMA185 TaxID=679318 RepID=UPI0008785EA3|nr:MFS transporter [Rhodococcus sp. WMMA185]AOW91634.1 MFS transporter [Rhodococcus sp. WMMA185]
MTLKESRIADPVTDKKFRGLQWRMLLATMFCYAFFYTGRQTFGFAIPGIEAELGLSKEVLGAISGLLLWTYAIGQIINGNIVDKIGGRRVMTAGTVLSTALNWVTSFAIGPLSLGAAWAANGYAQAMGWTAGGRVISNWWAPSERGRSFGFYTFAGGVASVVAYLTSTIVVDTLHLDWEWIFRVPVLLMLVGGIVFYLLSRESPDSAKIVPPKHFTKELTVEHEAITNTDTSDEDTTEEDARLGESSLSRYAHVLSNPRIWSTGFAIGFLNAARYGLLTWVPVYFLSTDSPHGDGGISPVWTSVALPIGMAVGALVNGEISDRLFGSRRDLPIILFTVIGAMASITMYAAPLGITTGMIVLFLTGFFVYGPQSSFWALTVDISGTKVAGTAIGVVNFFAYLFAGAASPITGYIMDVTGKTSYIFPIVAACCLVSALATLTIRHRPPSRELAA